MTSKNVIKRWAVDISQWRPTIKEIAFACSCIQSEERERLMRFHFREDFNASLIGRLLMRKFVNNLTGIEYDKIELNRDDRGKPILVNQLIDNQHIDFNVSHQGSFSVLAGLSQMHPSSTKKTSSNGPNDNRMTIGVDVMKFEYTGGKPLNEFFRLMYRNFSDYEWKFIKSHSTDHDKLKAFMRNWTLKECYVKNIGIGITVNLQKISFQLSSKSELKLDSPATDVKLKLNDTFIENWIFEEHLIDENHCAAVSIKNPSIDYELNKFEIITIDDLLMNAVSLQQPDESYASKVICKDYKKYSTKCT